MILQRAARLLLPILILFFIHASQAATLCVDAARGDDTGTGDCVSGSDGYWSSPFRTIGAALAVALPQDDLWVAEGTYAETELVVPFGIDIFGGMKGTESVLPEPPLFSRRSVVQSAPSTSTGGVLELSGNNTLRALHVSTGSRTMGSAVVVLPCPSESPCPIRIRDCEFSSSAAGIRLVESIMAPGTDLELSNSLLHDNGTGLQVDRRWDGRLSYRGRGNTWFHNTAGVRMGTHEELHFDTSDEAFIENGRGLTLYTGEELDFRFRSDNMSVLGSASLGIELGASGYMHLDGMRGATLRGNGDIPLYLVTDGGGLLDIEQSDISDNRQGLYVVSTSGGSGGFRLIRSRLTDNRGWAVSGASTFGLDSLRSEHSLIRGNGGGIVESPGEVDSQAISLAGSAVYGNGPVCLKHGSTQTAPAEGNYWGYNSSSQIAACMVGPVDFDPWVWPASGLARDAEPRRLDGAPQLSTDPALPDLPHDRPAAGSRVTVKWTIDTSTSGSAVGSFGGSMRWDPRILSFVSVSPGSAGFSLVCNQGEVDAGILRCSGTQTARGTGRLELACVTFDVVGPVRWPSPLDLEWTALDSDATSTPPYEDMLPLVISRDDYLRVAPLASYGDVVPDGRIDSGDALAVLSREIGQPLPNETVERISEHLGDANGDGSTNSTDGNVILSWEAGLPTPRPIGETNLAEDDCAATGTAPTARLKGKVVATLVLPSHPPLPGQPYPVELVLDNKTARRIGSYTAELAWNTARWGFHSVESGGPHPLQKPLTNTAATGEGRLPMAAADPAGAGPGPMSVVVLKLWPAAGANPLADLSVRFRALAGVSPDFPDLLPVLRVLQPKGQLPKVNREAARAREVPLG